MILIFQQKEGLTHTQETFEKVAKNIPTKTLCHF